MDEAGYQRLEGLAVGGRPGRGDGSHRAAEEAVVHHDDFVRAVLADAAPLARQLERALVRLGARVREEDAVHRRVVDQHLRELDLRLAVEDVGAVDQLAGLLADRLHQSRIGVAEDVGRDPGDEVEVLLAVDVPHAGALAAHERDRQPPGGLHVELRFEGLDVIAHAYAPVLIAPVFASAIGPRQGARCALLASALFDLIEECAQPIELGLRGVRGLQRLPQQFPEVARRRDREGVTRAALARAGLGDERAVGAG